MYIIRTKPRDDGRPTPVVMKTPLGPAFVAFTAVEIARGYLAATGYDAHCTVQQLADLLAVEPSTLDAGTRLLLLPSLDAVRTLLRDPASFPYERFIAARPNSR